MQRKILFILHYPPPVHGSAVIGGFIKESKVINGTFNCRYVNLGTSATVAEIGHKSLKKLYRYISLIWQVKKHIITFRPDMCYLTPTAKGPGFYKDALIIAIIKLFRIKTVFHYHNKGVSSRQDNLIDNLLYRFVFRKTNVILLSKLLYPDIHKYVPESRVYYCPNGIPDLKDENSSGGRRVESEKSEKGYSVIGIQYSVSKNEKTVTKNQSIVELLFLSHLIKSKGVLVLIEACCLLRDRGIEFHCTIAGGDAEMTPNGVEEIVAGENLEDYISVIGPKNGEEKLELFERTDIFVHPSFNDCQPLGLIEAMQFSLPVVSTFEGAIPDVVDDDVTGFLVPQKDATALADKLELLIKDPGLRQKMGAAGRAKYEREFTLEKFEKRMVEILKEVGST